MPPGVDPTVVTMAKAIRQQETGGGADAYTKPGASGEFGAYQFLPSTWNSLAPKFGVSVPLNQATKADQDAVAYNYLVDLKNKGFSPAQTAAAWNAGEAKAQDGSWQTNVGTNSQGVHYDTPSYVAGVVSHYQQFKTGGDMSALPQNTPSAAPTYGATFPSSPDDNPITAGFKALGNLPSSAIGLGKDAISMLLHPIQTVENIGGAAIGAVEKLTGQAPDANTDKFDSLAASLKQRYGSLEALQNTAENDPFGFGADIAGLAAGGASVIGKGAELGDLASRTAQVATSPLRGAASGASGKIADILATPDQEAIDAANATGVTLPAGAMTKSPIVQRAEALATLGSGSRNYEQIYTNAIDRMNTVADDVARSTGAAQDLTSAGEKIAEGFKAVSGEYRKAYSALYDALQSRVGDVAAQTQPLLEALDSIIAEKKAIGDTSNLKWFQEKRDVLIGKKPYAAPTFTTLRKLKTNIGQLIDAKFTEPFVKTNIQQLKHLYGATESAIAATAKATGEDGIIQLYKQANDAYKTALSFTGSQYARTIRNLSDKGQFNKLAEELIKPSTPIEDVPKIMHIVGQEGAANIQSALIQKVFESSRNAEGNFTQKGILRNLDKYKTADGRNRLEAALTPEQFKGIQDLGKVADALGNVQKIVSGSQTTYLFRIAAEIGSVGYAMLIDIPTGNFLSAGHKLAAVGIGEGASYFLTSPKGQLFLKWAISHGSEIKAEAAKAGLANTTGTTGEQGAPEVPAEAPVAPTAPVEEDANIVPPVEENPEAK